MRGGVGRCRRCPGKELNCKTRAIEFLLQSAVTVHLQPMLKRHSQPVKSRPPALEGAQTVWWLAERTTDEDGECNYVLVDLSE